MSVSSASFDPTKTIPNTAGERLKALRTERDSIINAIRGAVLNQDVNDANHWRGELQRIDNDMEVLGAWRKYQ